MAPTGHRDSVPRAQNLADCSCPAHDGSRSAGAYVGGKPLGEESIVDLEVGIGDALGTDYFHLRERLTAAQLDYLERAR